MSAQRNLTDREHELLSAYLDDALSAAARAALEQRLQTDADLRRELATLRATVALLANLPPLAAPRDFTLTPAQARPTPRLLRVALSPTFSAASAAAAVFLLIAGVVLLIGAPRSQPRDTSRVTGLSQAETTATVRGDAAIAALSSPSPQPTATPSPRQMPTILATQVLRPQAEAIGEDETVATTAAATRAPLPTATIIAGLTEGGPSENLGGEAGSRIASPLPTLALLPSQTLVVPFAFAATPTISLNDAFLSDAAAPDPPGPAPPLERAFALTLTLAASTRVLAEAAESSGVEATMNPLAVPESAPAMPQQGQGTVITPETTLEVAVVPLDSPTPLPPTATVTLMPSPAPTLAPADHAPPAPQIPVDGTAVAGALLIITALILLITAAGTTVARRRRV
ncbi:MAG: hypothetical protein GYB67_07375 [Chloroflexi bacterium]|nr:hypothetical protein [Chloroflexota bacterium]